MKFAIDFDGTIKDKETSAFFIDYNRCSFFINYAITAGHNIHIVSSRSKIDKKYIEYNIPAHMKVICLGNDENKIKYLNKNNYDVIIDDTEYILQKAEVPYKFDIKKVSWKELIKLFFNKKFFSPGPVPCDLNVSIQYSHRSDGFRTLYKEVKDTIRKELNSKHKNILFIQGSATSGIESVLSSLNKRDSILLINNGTFGERATTIAKKYFKTVYNANTVAQAKKYINTKHLDVFLYVQFETSKSINNIKFEALLPLLKKKNIITISDSVSAVGFYDIPKTDIVCTSSSKLLGGIPVLGVVFYNNNKIFSKEAGSFYLDIQRYIKSDLHNETPHTSLIPQLLSLKTNISKRVTKKEIEINCKQFTTKKIKIINSKIAPVLTFEAPEKDIKKLMKIFKIFNIEPYYNKVYMRNYFQISMFSYHNPYIYKLINDIIEVVL